MNMMHDSRHDRLGIHSIGEFRATAPSLDEAKCFYTAFGLDLQPDGKADVLIRKFVSPHVWGRLGEGARRKCEWTTLYCFEYELEALRSRALDAGVGTIARPCADPAGFWIRNFHGVGLQLRPGVETTPDESSHASPPLPVDGVGRVSFGCNTRKVVPMRMSHFAFATASMPGRIDLCEQVLGLRPLARSGDAWCSVTHRAAATTCSPLWPAPAPGFIAWAGTFRP
jgi:hypothetical protein